MHLQSDSVKLCLIGNSHLLCIKQALENGDSLLRGESFVAAGGQRLALLSVRERVLDPGIADAQIVTSSEGGDVRIDDHDAFVIIGNGFGLPAALRAFERYRPLKYQQPRLGLVSSALFVQIVADLLRSTVAMQIAERIRSESDKPILIVPQPAPHAGVGRQPKEVEWQEKRYRRWQVMFDTEVGGFLSTAFDAAARKAVGTSVEFIPQPQETFDGYLTHKQFAATTIGYITPGAVARKANYADVSHMNAAYGAFVVDRIERALGV